MNAKTVNKSGWGQLANSNVFIEFIDTALRGCAQVMFQNNPLTGLFFFIAIFIGAYGEGNRRSLMAVFWERWLPHLPG